MLHEILLSLSGHPSPLLRPSTAEADALAGITPPERQLLASAAHLSDVHIKLITSTAQVSASHPSTICRAVAAAINSVHLAAFQRKVLEVEAGILRDDPALVGAYNIVPLTAVMGEFKQWTRRMDWLWEMVRFMVAEEDWSSADAGAGSAARRGVLLMGRLRTELQSGYQDVQETAMSLVKVAETAWLRHASAWILYGRLPTSGGEDFFVRRTDGQDEAFTCDPSALPSFVTPATASSMLFIGKSLNHVQVRTAVDSGLRGLERVASKLRELADLSFPLDSASFARTVRSIRLSLSESTLQNVLPLSRVIETLQLLRDFFLLGRGEFAMALTHEADDKIRSRWRRADNLAYEKGDALRNVTVKDGEVAAVLGRTWAVLASLQGQHAEEEDEQLELARDIISLHLSNTQGMPPLTPAPGLDATSAKMVAALPFHSLLFSVPASLSIQLPSPLDMVFSLSDLQLYSSINAYLLSMRRAHIRLTDLWKMTSLRRQHPAVKGADEQATMLRERWTARSSVMRSSWTTASAAIFFLGETEAYLQTEVVAGLWEGFQTWLTGSDRQDQRPGTRSEAATPAVGIDRANGDVDDEDEDLWLQDEASHNEAKSYQQPKPDFRPSHDPQTLSTAHKLYLHTLVFRLLLTQPSFTEPLYTLLIHIDHLVTHIQRLHSIFTSIDLEQDAGVVDAFVDLDKEESEVKALLRGVEGKIRRGIEDIVDALRKLESDDEFVARWEGEAAGGAAGYEEDDMLLVMGGGAEGMAYKPARVGGINRLLMKLDFGTWLGQRSEWQP